MVAVFRCDRFPSLFVSGVGRFRGGVLEASGDDAEALRRLVKHGGFGVSEDKPEPKPKDDGAEPDKPSPKRGRPRRSE